MRRTTTILLSILGILVMICGLGAFWIVELFVFLIGGWVFFLVRTIPQVQLNWGEIAVAASALAVFTYMMHHGLRWWAQGSRENEQSSGSNWPVRYSLTVVALIVLMFVAGTSMIGLAHQMSWLAAIDDKILQSDFKEAARRNHSLSNIRQMGLGTANYENTQDRFPAGCVIGEDAELLHGWLTQLLPYVEEDLLYDKIDLSQPWNSNANADVFRNRIPSFQSPGVVDDRAGQEFPTAHYSANVLAMGGGKQRTADDFPDGVANTIFIGEANGNYKPWGSPTNWRDPALGLGQSPDGFGGPWKDGQTIVAFGDGHAQVLNNDIDPAVFRALSTPADGESLDLDNID